MLTITKFNTLIRNLVCLLILICLVLIVMLEFKNLYSVPSVLVLQENFEGDKDRIVKTKDSLNDFETIFEALDIQDFQATKTQLLVLTGQKDKQSSLELVNIKTKESKKIDYSGKFVSELVAGGDKFVMLVEDMNGEYRSYKSKMAMVTESSPQVQDLNPQFLATAAYSIFINPSGSLLLFSGVANNQYVVDLDNLESVTKLNMDTKLTLGFINDKQLAFANYLASDGVQVEILDLLTDQTKTGFLGNEQYNQIVVGNDSESISYTQAKEINGTRVNGLKSPSNKSVYFMPDFSFENIQISPSSDYLLFEKTSIDNLLSSTKRFEYSPKKSFSIYHLKTKYLSNGVIDGVKAIWAK
jgi:hypothetical protein